MTGMSFRKSFIDNAVVVWHWSQSIRNLLANLGRQPRCKRGMGHFSQSVNSAKTLIYIVVICMASVPHLVWMKPKLLAGFVRFPSYAHFLCTMSTIYIPQGSVQIYAVFEKDAYAQEFERLGPRNGVVN